VIELISHLPSHAVNQFSSLTRQNRFSNILTALHGGTFELPQLIV